MCFGGAGVVAVDFVTVVQAMLTDDCFVRPYDWAVLTGLWRGAHCTWHLAPHLRAWFSRRWVSEPTREASVKWVEQILRIYLPRLGTLVACTPPRHALACVVLPAAALFSCAWLALQRCLDRGVRIPPYRPSPSPCEAFEIRRGMIRALSREERLCLMGDLTHSPGPLACFGCVRAGAWYPVLQVQLVTNVFRKTTEGWKMIRHHASHKGPETLEGQAGKAQAEGAGELLMDNDFRASKIAEIRRRVYRQAIVIMGRSITSRLRHGRA